MDHMNNTLLSLTLNRNGRISWPSAQAIKQQFSFSDSIIYYITKNPSLPKVYLKFVQCCKYFFEKNPIILATSIRYIEGSEYRLYCHAGPSVKIDFTKLSSKIWVTNKFNFCSSYNTNFAALCVSKIYRCEEAFVYAGYITINIKDFQLLAKIFERFYFHEAHVCNNNRISVALEKILELTTNAREFIYYFDKTVPAATSSTMKNINKLTNLDNLQKILLYDVPEIINLDHLDEFIKSHKDSKFWLKFVDNISLHHKINLNRLIDGVIESGISRCLITYDGHNSEKYGIMRRLYDN